MIRMCLTGVPHCSGLNPCEPCHLAIMGRVMPKAMIAGGFNQDPAQAQAFLQAYMKAWREMQAGLLASTQQALPPAPTAPPAPPAPEPYKHSPGSNCDETCGPIPIAPPIPAATSSEETKTETLPLATPEPPAPMAEAAPTTENIPPPHVEGLTGSDEGVPDAPPAEAVTKKKRRGLPRSLQRKSKAAGSRTKEED